METVTYNVCLDCNETVISGHVTYYGDNEDHWNTRQAHINERIDQECSEGYFSEHSVCTDEFSRSQCEICNSRLGGSRYDVIFIRSK